MTFHGPSFETLKYLMELNYPGATIRFSIDAADVEYSFVMQSITALNGDYYLGTGSFIIEKDGKVLARIQIFLSEGKKPAPRLKPDLTGLVEQFGINLPNKKK
jgi:hypothetical protein